MRFYFYLFGGLSLIFAFFGDCSQDVHVGVDLVTRVSNNLVQIIFKEVLSRHENVVTSPFGLLSNLAMLLEASSDKTRGEFIQTLNISEGDVGSLRRGFKAFCELFLKYSSEPEAAGSFNSATLKSSFKLNSTYKDVLQKYYCANISENSNETEQFIELGSIAGVMSHWKDYEKLAIYTFLSHQSLLPFTEKNGSVVSVPMIPQVGIFRSKRWENSQVILLPLQAKLVNFLLIIPDKLSEVDVLMRKINEISFPLLVQSLPKIELEVFIPQMAVVSKHFNYTSMLIRNGIRRAFDPEKAEFKKITDLDNPKVFLKQIEQNSFVSTSFVALNSVSGISSPLNLHNRSKRDTAKVYIDRPFLFFVLQKDTQLVLLAGKVENPAQIPT